MAAFKNKNKIKKENILQELANNSFKCLRAVVVVVMECPWGVHGGSHVAAEVMKS